jgi:hypothetical protein
MPYIDKEKKKKNDRAYYAAHREKKWRIIAHTTIRTDWNGCSALAPTMLRTERKRYPKSAQRDHSYAL